MLAVNQGKPTALIADHLDLSTVMTNVDHGVPQVPNGIAVAADGTIYVAEAQNNDIRVISPDKKIIRTITSPAMAHPCTLVVVDEKP